MTTIIANTLSFSTAISGTGRISVGGSVTTTFQGTNVTYKCTGFDKLGNPNQGVLYFSPGISGEVLSKRHDADPLVFGTALSGTGVEGEVAGSGEILEFSTAISYYTYLIENLYKNWVQWSKIGSLDFTIDKTNIAGKRPVDWPGYVWELRKLKNHVMVYGENGVTKFLPVDVNYGIETILRVGLKGKNAVTGNDDMHWFITIKGDLYQYDGKLTLLGYRDQLNSLTTPSMYYDFGEGLVYICDGTYGFVYNPDEGSLVEGPAAVTGIGYQDGTTYVVASTATITSLPFEAETDIIDMGTRKQKNIFNIELMTTLTGTLQCKIGFRNSISDAFTDSPWFTFTPAGIAFCPCYGTEFKFYFKASAYDALKTIDEIKINGIIYGFSFLDPYSNR